MTKLVKWPPKRHRQGTGKRRLSRNKGSEPCHRPVLLSLVITIRRHENTYAVQTQGHRLRHPKVSSDQDGLLYWQLLSLHPNDQRYWGVTLMNIDVQSIYSSHHEGLGVAVQPIWVVRNVLF